MTTGWLCPPDPAILEALAARTGRDAETVETMPRGIAPHAAGWRGFAADVAAGALALQQAVATRLGEDLLLLARDLRWLEADLRAECAALRAEEEAVRALLHSSPVPLPWPWSIGRLPASLDPAWRLIARALGLPTP